MTDTIFTKISLADGRLCEVLEIKAGHGFRAMAEYNAAAAKQKPEAEMAVYLIRQVLIVNGRQLTIDQIEDLSFDDFQYIADVLDAQMITEKSYK